MPEAASKESASSSLMKAFVAEYRPMIGPAFAAVDAFAATANVAELAAPRRLFHRIAGVASLLGWPALGTVGAIGEDLIALVQDGRLPPRQELAALLRRALQEVERSLKAAEKNEQPPLAPVLAAATSSAPSRRGAEAEGVSDSKVLVVDDDPLSARLVELSLKKAGIQVRHCKDPREALAAIDAARPDLILLDIMMPGQDGYETFRQIRALATVDKMPIVFITRVSDVNEKVAALELGGDDYITKPFEPHELLARVRSHIAKAAAAREAAYKDALTSAWNRRYYDQRIEQELKRSQSGGHPLCLAMMDLDRFKQVNDVHGHQGGDDVLVELVQRAKLTLRRPDIVARFGGDEIALLLPDTTAEDGRRVMLRLCEAIRGVPFPLRTGQSLRATASIGLTMATPTDTVERLAARADQALYESKRNGRDQVTLL